MKLLLFIFSFLLFSLQAWTQSYEMLNGDTINKKDVNNKRQGLWVVKANPSKNKGYQLGAMVEEGKYQNSRKMGLWKAYFPNGKLKSEITYKGSRPYGAYTLYYKNGKIEEKGNWERTKNTGNFKRYHETEK